MITFPRSLLDLFRVFSALSCLWFYVWGAYLGFSASVITARPVFFSKTNLFWKKGQEVLMKSKTNGGVEPGVFSIERTRQLKYFRRFSRIFNFIQVILYTISETGLSSENIGPQKNRKWSKDWNFLWPFFGQKLWRTVVFKFSKLDSWSPRPDLYFEVSLSCISAVV